MYSSTATWWKATHNKPSQQCLRPLNILQQKDLEKKHTTLNTENLKLEESRPRSINLQMYTFTKVFMGKKTLHVKW